MADRMELPGDRNVLCNTPGLDPADQLPVSAQDCQALRWPLRSANSTRHWEASLNQIHGPELGDRLKEQLERLSEVILPLQDRCHRMMIRSLAQLRPAPSA